MNFEKSLMKLFNVFLANVLFNVSRSVQCRRILGGRNLVRVRNVVIAAIFDFLTVEDWGE